MIQQQGYNSHDKDWQDLPPIDALLDDEQEQEQETLSTITESTATIKPNQSLSILRDHIDLHTAMYHQHLMATNRSIACIQPEHMLNLNLSKLSESTNSKSKVKPISGTGTITVVTKTTTTTTIAGFPVVDTSAAASQRLGLPKMKSSSDNSKDSSSSNNDNSIVTDTDTDNDSSDGSELGYSPSSSCSSSPSSFPSSHHQHNKSRNIQGKSRSSADYPLKINNEPSSFVTKLTNNKSNRRHQSIVTTVGNTGKSGTTGNTSVTCSTSNTTTATAFKSNASTTNKKKTSLHKKSLLGRNKRTTTSYDAETTAYLKKAFFNYYSKQYKLTKEQRETVIYDTGLRSRNITYWFSNHKRRLETELRIYRKIVKENGIKDYDAFVQWRKDRNLPPDLTRAEIRQFKETHQTIDRNTVAF